MNVFLSKNLYRILAVLSRATLRRYQPRIIAVTGTAGKTSAKDAIFSILEKKFLARKSQKSYNTEIGLPLTILNGRNRYRSVLGWVAECFVAFWRLMISHDYPRLLVLEYGVGKPGDMEWLVSIARPDIAVITALGNTPVHIEYFKTAKDLFWEKEKIVTKLTKDGWAILNADDPEVLSVAKMTKARVMTFGFSEYADVRIVHYELRLLPGTSMPEGVSFKLGYRGTVIPIRMRGFGRPQAYASAAAAAVGVAMGMNLVEIAEGLARHIPPPGRLRVLRGVRGSIIIDDTYNSSPLAVKEALDLLVAIPGRRKIAVLGDMKELGSYAQKAHEVLGHDAAIAADLIFTVGELAGICAREARAYKKMSGRRSEVVIEFADAIRVGKFLQEFLQEGDVVLLKGSESMRMERAVFQIMLEPERAEDLLVRQDIFWKNRL